LIFICHSSPHFTIHPNISTLRFHIFFLC